MSTQVPNEIISSDNNNFTYDELEKFILNSIDHHLKIGNGVRFSIPNTDQNINAANQIIEEIKSSKGYEIKSGIATLLNEKEKEYQVFWTEIEFSKK